MTKTFIEHLELACSRPIKESIFLKDYSLVLDEVAKHGIFRVHGLPIEAPSGVYSPHETSSTQFFIDHLAALGLDKPCGRVLEMGCGAGAIALHVARAGSSVVACDIDPAAVDATRANSAANGIAVEARQSDLLSCFRPDEKFDVIIFNQPFFHVDREIEVRERALSDFGGMLYRRFMAQAANHLTPGGRVVIAYSNCSNTSILQQPGWELELRAFDFDACSCYIRTLFNAVPA